MRNPFDKHGENRVTQDRAHPVFNRAREGGFMRSWQAITSRGALLLGCLVVLGCGSTTQQEPPTPTHQNLQAIGDAYVRATQSFNRPPTSLNELLPSLRQHGKTDQLLRSPNDNTPFEIVWGIELRMLKATGNAVPIVAYERNGKDGLRYVLRGRSEVLHLSESALKGCTFPADYKFPF
jgi:hypothetical protein